MHSTRTWTKRKYGWRLLINVRIVNLRRSNWKVYSLRDISREHCRLALRHGKTRKEMCGTTFKNWQTKSLSNCVRSLHDHQFKKGRTGTNWHEQSQKWTRACDRRLAHLISSIHNASDYMQYCHVENTALHCRLALFQDSDFAGDLEDSK